VTHLLGSALVLAAAGCLVPALLLLANWLNDLF
jgi:hypothetical protein